MRMHTAQGDVVLAFLIGELADRLAKSAWTVRHWHRLGVLPPTPLLYPVRGRSPRRRYSQETRAARAPLLAL